MSSPAGTRTPSLSKGLSSMRGRRPLAPHRVFVTLLAGVGARGREVSLLVPCRELSCIRESRGHVVFLKKTLHSLCPTQTHVTGCLTENIFRRVCPSASGTIQSRHEAAKTENCCPNLFFSWDLA